MFIAGKGPIAMEEGFRLKGLNKIQWIEMCIEELEDPFFASEVCDAAFEVHRDEAVFFELFQILIKYDYSQQAIDLLEKNFSMMPAK